jgi:phosphate transport system substrate-binding protein
MKQLLKILCLCLGCLETNALASSDQILVKAPRTLVVLAQKWAEAYQQEQPQVEIEVASGGPDAGLTALQNNKADLALSSRSITPSESQAYAQMYGKRPREYRVAVESLCVYVNAENHVTELDLEQVARIFAGKIRNWKQVGGTDAPITVYSRDKNSGAYEFLRGQILKGADFAGGAQTVPSATAVLKAVSKDKNGIGFAGWAKSASARVLNIKKNPDSPAIEPTGENLLSGRYPIQRYLYLYLHPALDKGKIAAFLDWIRSDEGQQVAQATGCHPLPPNWREKAYVGTNKKPQDPDHAK